MVDKKEKKYVSDNARLMAEWNWGKNNELGLNPQTLTCGSGKKVWWICNKGHEWQAQICSRKSGRNCPYCAGQMVIKGYNDLQTVNPTLAQEWNFMKNDKLTPADVMPSSNKKVWWICSNGHEWQANINDRNNRNRGCPYCSHQKVITGVNDLATTYPSLAKQWHPFKNTNKPTQVFPQSNKSVWWICEKGHEFQSSPAHRTVRKSVCPICSGKKILAGFNDLATTHAFLIREWDFEKNNELLPIEVSKGSEKQVWWKCIKGHSWSAAVYSRASGIGCPSCAKEFQASFPEKAIYFYIKRIFPDATANYRSNQINSLELDIFIPSLQIGIEYDGERWHQKIENDLFKNKLCSEMGIVLIRIREPACPFLSDERSICILRESKKTGLDITIRHLLIKIREIVDIDCSIDINLERDRTAIFNLLNPVEKDNNILLINPTLASEWDYQKNGCLLPQMVTAGSDKKVWWTCNMGHSYQASVASRARGRGCPICSGKKILKGFNDFKSKCPELAKDWDYTKNDITPDMVAWGSDKKFWWICAEGHSYQCSINNRRSGQACPICSNKKVLPGFNDINTTHPHLACEWDYEQNQIHPTDVTAGSHKKAWWICSVCGYKWITPIYHRTSGHGCPECAKERRKKKSSSDDTEKT